MGNSPNIDFSSDNSLTTMVVSFISGILLQLNESILLHWDFPPVVLHSLQIFAWIVAIITGLITIYKHFKGKK